MTELVYCGIALFFWIVLIFTFHKDRSRYRNCYILFLAIVFTIAALTFLAGEHQKKAIIALMIITLLILLAVPFFLITNGILMYEREGHSLSNLLSLILGIVVAVVELATFVGALIPEFAGPEWRDNSPLFRLSGISMFISMTVLYISMAFVIFMIYCVFLQLIPRKRDFDYVIIHGAGLLRGREVSKLLADRIDKAIEVYHKDPTPPILIPSGGKGDDEEISEAEAMEKYLIEHGIPKENIIKEDKSMTTRENLLFSKKIICERGGSPYVALVTSNYHVYRALSLCESIDLACTGIGAHVALYYWPSALIREFAAIMSSKKNFVIFAAGWLLTVIPSMYAIMGSIIQ